MDRVRAQVDSVSSHERLAGLGGTAKGVTERARRGCRMSCQYTVTCWMAKCVFIARELRVPLHRERLNLKHTLGAVNSHQLLHNDTSTTTSTEKQLSSSRAKLSPSLSFSLSLSLSLPQHGYIPAQTHPVQRASERMLPDRWAPSSPTTQSRADPTVS